MYYALPLKYDSDRREVGAEALVLNVDPPRVYANVLGRFREVARLDEKGTPIVRMAWAGTRVAQLVLLALAKLRSDPSCAERAAELYYELTHRCARCHRPITASVSVQRGLGPECAKKGGRVL